MILFGSRENVEIGVFSPDPTGGSGAFLFRALVSVDAWCAHIGVL